MVNQKQRKPYTLETSLAVSIRSLRRKRMFTPTYASNFTFRENSRKLKKSVN